MKREPRNTVANLLSSKIEQEFLSELCRAYLIM